MQHGVEVVVLNSCDSAKKTKTGESLAEIFMACGVKMVVAMAFKTLDSAMEKFMNYLYASLLIQGRPLTQAVQVARQKLQDDRARRGRFGKEVEVSDYMVPVLYALQGWDFQHDIERKAFQPLTDFFKKRLAFSKTRNELHFIGRDSAILALEHGFLQAPSLLLHGAAGVGKTALARHLCWWWRITGFVERTFWLDLDPTQGISTFETVRNVLTRQVLKPYQVSSAQDIERFFHQHKCLLVVDHLDALYNPVSKERSLISGSELQTLNSFVKGLTAKGSLVLSISRLLQHPFNELKSDTAICIEGLDLDECHEYMEARLGQSWTKLVAAADDRIYLETTMQLMGSLPVCLDMIANFLQHDKGRPQFDQHRTPDGMFFALLSATGPFYRLIVPWDRESNRCLRSLANMFEEFGFEPIYSGKAAAISAIYGYHLASPLTLAPFFGAIVPSSPLSKSYYRFLRLGLDEGRSLANTDNDILQIGEGLRDVRLGPLDTKDKEGKRTDILGDGLSPDQRAAQEIDAMLTSLTLVGFAQLDASCPDEAFFIHPLLTIYSRCLLKEWANVVNDKMELDLLGDMCLAFTLACAQFVGNRSSKFNPHNVDQLEQAVELDWNLIEAFLMSVNQKDHMEILCGPGGHAISVLPAAAFLSHILGVFEANPHVLTLLYQEVEELVRGMLKEVIKILPDGLIAADWLLRYAMSAEILLCTTQQADLDAINACLGTADQLLSHAGSFTAETEPVWMRLRSVQASTQFGLGNVRKALELFDRTLRTQPKNDTIPLRRVVHLNLASYLRCRLVLNPELVAGEEFAKHHVRLSAHLRLLQEGNSDMALLQEIEDEFQAPIGNRDLGAFVKTLPEFAEMAPIVHEVLKMSLSQVCADIIPPGDFLEFVQRQQVITGDMLVRNLDTFSTTLPAAARSSGSISEIWHTSLQRSLDTGNLGYSRDTLQSLADAAWKKREWRTVLRLTAEIRRVSPMERSRLTFFTTEVNDAFCYAGLQEYNTSLRVSNSALKLYEELRQRENVAPVQIAKPIILLAFCQFMVGAGLHTKILGLYPAPAHALVLLDMVLAFDIDLKFVMPGTTRSQLFRDMMTLIAKDDVPKEIFQRKVGSERLHTVIARQDAIFKAIGISNRANGGDDDGVFNELVRVFYPIYNAREATSLD